MKKIILPDNNFKYLAPFFIFFIFFISLLSILEGHYEISDEIEIITILSGSDGFPADVVTVFLSQALSYILYALYKFQPEISWFGVLLYISTFIGSSLIFGVILRNTAHDKITWFIYVPLLILFLGYCTLFLSFTSASLLLFFGALLSVLEISTEENETNSNTFFMIILALSLLFSFLLRWKLIFFLSIFILPLMFFINKKHLKSIIVLFLLIVCLVFVDRAFFKSEISSYEFKEFSEYNELRSQFHDKIDGSDHGKITKSAIKEANWSFNDYMFYKYWILYDNKKFNSDNLSIFLEKNRQNTNKDESKFINSKLISTEGISDQLDFILIFSFGFLSLVSYKLTHSSFAKKNNKIVHSVLYISFVFLMILLVTRFVPRVFVPVFCLILGVFSIATKTEPKPGENSFIKLTAISFSILFFLFSISHIYIYGYELLNKLHNYKINSSHALAVLRHIDNDLKKQAIVIQMLPVTFGSVGFKNIDPFNEGLIRFKNIKIFPGGTSINSPRYFKILNQMGLNDGREFLKWTINNPDAMLVLFSRGRQTEEIKQRWETYYNSNISEKNIELKVTQDYRNKQGTGIVIFQIVETETQSIDDQ